MMEGGEGNKCLACTARLLTLQVGCIVEDEHGGAAARLGPPVPVGDRR